jgi:hypothetical protein
VESNIVFNGRAIFQKERVDERPSSRIGNETRSRQLEMAVSKALAASVIIEERGKREL